MAQYILQSGGRSLLLILGFVFKRKPAITQTGNPSEKLTLFRFSPSTAPAVKVPFCNSLTLSSVQLFRSRRCVVSIFLSLPASVTIERATKQPWPELMFKKSLLNHHKMFYPCNDQKPAKSPSHQMNPNEGDVWVVIKWKEELEPVLHLFNHSFCCSIRCLLGL